VANRVEVRGDRLIAAQQTVYNYLPQTIKQFGYNEAHLFKAVVRNKRNQIEDAANNGRIAASDEAGLALFTDLAAEFEAGINQ
jgi:hypothetical protein